MVHEGAAGASAAASAGTSAWAAGLLAQPEMAMTATAAQARESIFFTGILLGYRYSSIVSFPATLSSKNEKPVSFLQNIC
jgi:hypothetical protein